jgi:hypothetical protein
MPHCDARFKGSDQREVLESFKDENHPRAPCRGKKQESDRFTQAFLVASCSDFFVIDRGCQGIVEVNPKPRLLRQELQYDLELH